MLGSVGAGLFHSGGQVTHSRVGERSMSTADLASAKKYHDGGGIGLRNDEIPAILQTGEVVLSRDHVKAMNGSSSGGDTININMTVNASDASSFRQSQRQISADLAKQIALSKKRNT